MKYDYEDFTVWLSARIANKQYLDIKQHLAELREFCNTEECDNEHEHSVAMNRIKRIETVLRNHSIDSEDLDD